LNLTNGLISYVSAFKDNLLLRHVNLTVSYKKDQGPSYDISF